MTKDQSDKSSADHNKETEPDLSKIIEENYKVA